MKALVLQAPKQFEMEDRPVPEIGAGDVLIAVAACGICGSDIHGMDGSTGRRQTPLIMGHEAAGVIAEVGADVRDWAPGGRVTFDSTVYCGECSYCRAGKINLCVKRRVLGVACDDFHQDGAFAEYVAVPQRILYRLPESVSFEHAAMIEPVSVAVHAVSRAHLAPGDTVLVVGAGMIGLLIIQVARWAGCGKIIAVDLEESKLALAKQLGADAALNPKDCAVSEAVLEHTNGLGADAAFEAVGLAETIRTGIASLKKGGALCLVGNLSPSVEVPLQTIVARELTLHGSCASCGDYPACIDLVQRGVVQVAPLISAVAPLAEGAAWFDRLYRGEPGLMKVILTPGAQGE